MQLSTVQNRPMSKSEVVQECSGVITSCKLSLHHNDQISYYLQEPWSLSAVRLNLYHMEIRTRGLALKFYLITWRQQILINCLDLPLQTPPKYLFSLGQTGLCSFRSVLMPRIRVCYIFPSLQLRVIAPVYWMHQAIGRSQYPVFPFFFMVCNHLKWIQEDSRMNQPVSA